MKNILTKITACFGIIGLVVTLATSAQAVVRRSRTGVVIPVTAVSNPLATAVSR